ncbi:Uncharacterised protein [Mycobacterium tuberculosis]|uniref:Uncharacterized protein n=1 Tax=Mycobacterium tuberculosis TaxID=1773 RepID=A0A654TIV8_MYCTX|nr:Uncharacterised protein [Mycobacterium tuberculosis]CKO16770.1 Uncharacterised protein [Mycobacterium tuberculosis]CKR58508.1 Uncharacterised protein [Mycobacterium tuberculosis]CKT42996.1 Uncharacterised protein [Mycobacterium tuberculosis]CNM05367.1 Uncharacterised protein [Mycobacterium tuberculosis]
MNQQRSPPRKWLFNPLERLVVSADHHGQLTLGGRRRAAADRCIHDVDPLRLELFGQIDCCRVGDGGVNRDNSAGLGVRRQSVVGGDHRTHLRVVEHGDADDVGFGDVGDACRCGGAALDERCHGLDPHIENGQSARPIEQTLSHRRALITQADISQAWCLRVSGHERRSPPPADGGTSHLWGRAPTSSPRSASAPAPVMTG